MFPKYCKNFIGAQNMPIHLITYIFNRGVDAPKTNLLRKALVGDHIYIYIYIYTIKEKYCDERFLSYNGDMSINFLSILCHQFVRMA